MEKTLQVYLPYPKSSISQKFGDNATAFYAGQGLKGHPAYDWAVSWATKIPNCTKDAYCYSVMHQNDPTLMDYRAAFFIVETETGVYEVSYGHMSTILALVGKTYRPGDTIGLIGNTGPVFVGQHEVTEAEKDAGSHAGSHLHGPQIRPVKKVKQLTKNSVWYLHDEKGFYKDKDGYYYETLAYENGYNGCVSLASFSTETLATDYKAALLTPEVVQEAAQALKAVQSQPVDLQRGLLAALVAWITSFLPK